MALLVPLVTWMLLELLLTASLAALYAAVRKLARTPADRYLFLKLAFAAVVFLPFFSLSGCLQFFTATPHGAAHALRGGAVSVQVASEGALLKIPFAVPCLIGCAAVYALAALAMLARIFASSVKLTTLAEAAKPVGVQNGVPVLTTDAKVPPATFGWIKPVILIPATVFAQIAPAELAMILAHEEQHIQRRDYLFNLLRALVQAVLVFSPWIHWLGKRFVEDMELSCDALTVERSRCSAKSYGSLLFRLGNDARPRKDLVFSGLFVSQSFLSRRIAAMKTLGRTRSRVVPLVAFACLSLLVGPALVSLGLENTVDNAVAGGTAAADGRVIYRLILSRKNQQGDSASGQIQLVDGGQEEIRAGRMLLTIKSLKDDSNWRLTIQTYDELQEKIVSSSTLIMHDTAGAKIESRFEGQSDSDITGLSFGLFPLADAQQAPSRPGLTETADDRVYLHFKQPTEIKDLIKTVAQLTGKNVVLDRGVHGKIQVDSDRPVTKPEAYQAFLQALRLLDLDVVESGRVIKIVNKAKAG